MHRRHGPLFAIVFALGAAATLSAQALRIDQIVGTSRYFDPKPITEWLNQVNAHQPDSGDAAATTVGRWSGTRLIELTNDLTAVVRAFQQSHDLGATRFKVRNQDFTPQTVQRLLGLTDDETARADVSRIAKRGLVLHTDIARYFPASGAVAQSKALMLDDGQHAGDESSSLHWPIARTMLNFVSSPATDDAVRDWYHAMIADGIRTRHWSLAVPNLEQALRQVPDDARILLHEGIVHETFGSDDIQNAVAALKARGDANISVGTQQEELLLAEGFLRRATIADPGLAEARLRLGHVLGQRDRHAEAVEELRRAATGTTDPALIYYAMLLLGREEAASGRYREARAALADAAARFPLAQSPLLAECQLARREDDPGRVTAALRRLESLPPGRDARYDPWWVYDIYPGRDADALIAKFYESFRSGNPK